MEVRRSKFTGWALVLGYCALILAVSSIPASSMPKSETLWSMDKVIHATEYALLGALLRRAFGLTWPAAGMFVLWLAAALPVAGFAAGDELYQSLTPGRDSSVGDFIADCIGACIGAAAYGGFFREASQEARRDGDRSQLSRP